MCPGTADYFLRQKENEYIVISSLLSSSQILKAKLEIDNFTIINIRYFDDQILYYKNLGNNINVYTFREYSLIENKGSTNIVRFGAIFGRGFLAQVFNSNSSIIATYDFNLESSFIRYDISLNLLKYPYTEISKIILIESNKKERSILMLALKDVFIYIRIEESSYNHIFEGNYTYTILDLNLNIIGTLTFKYDNYTNLKISELSENVKHNEFILCIKYYKSVTDCQIIKYENSNLIILENNTIFSTHEYYQNDKYYFSMQLFDGNKIGCYLFIDTYREKSDYFTVLQYINRKLSYYKNIKDTPFKSLNFFSSKEFVITMTDRGIGIVSHSSNTYLYYLSSICIRKNISLYTNTLLEFPINEFIIPGIEPLSFSFFEVESNLAIYKNSKEIKLGEIFFDLENFTYFLKIDTFFENPFKIEVKSFEYEYICDIYVNVIIDTNISTYKEDHKCFKNNDYDKINNILYSNLYDYFNINDEQSVIFEFTYENEPKGKELEFNFSDYPLHCIKNYTKVICNAPLSIFPRLEQLHLHSYLSCYNLIDVGWFEINDKNIYNIYSLINYNFDEVKEKYEPSKKITEYNPLMINYYYWFSCLSYCDDKKLEQKNCCNNILENWDIVFHKEYSHEKSIIEFFTDIFLSIIDLSEIYNDFDIEHMLDLMSDSKSFIGKILKKAKNVPELIPAVAIPFLEQLVNTAYRYHFVILKNDEYKKIVVSFPGITYYFQIIEEFLYANMVELPIKYGKKVFYVLEMYYSLFSKIETDIFGTLENLPGVKNKDYQVVFVGHSLGGAIATLASFYYIKKYNFTSENILITFGQPKVGSEVFAKELTNNLNQIYRIARPKDVAISFPPKGIDFLFKYIKTLKLMFEIAKFLGQIATGNFIGMVMTLYNFFGISQEDFAAEYSYLIRDRTFEDILYSHTGGLYMIDDNTNKVYHCADFFNEKSDHFICKNHNIKMQDIHNFLHHRNYLTTEQDMISICQRKKLHIFKLSTVFTYYNDLERRRLKITKNIRNIHHYNYNIQRFRKLNNIRNIQETLELFEEIFFKNDTFEFCYKYQSQNKLKSDDLILIINPKNNKFIGEICFSLNITLLINNDLDSLNCYFINMKNPFTLKIELEKEIIEEKELYIYIKGKVSGSLELYDLTKNKTLNISSSFIMPYINNFTNEKNINFILPKIDENCYINIILNDYGINDNKTYSSTFEIYKNQSKVDYEKNYLLLEKNNEYYFKYYPNQYELIINFIQIDSNKFLEKKFYIIDEQNITINYDIETKYENQSFGLLFEFNGLINIKGYFSNFIENEVDKEDYIVNSNNNYFILTKNEQFNYLNLNINIESALISELIISEINEMIIINKINSIYEIEKTKNLILLFDKSLKTNFSKFESFIFISINNKNNKLKLLTINGDIISSKNYIFTKLIDIIGIFVKSNENDIVQIKIIPQEISKYIVEETSTFFSNTFIDDKKYSIEFINNNEEIYVFYNSISNNLKIYELNNESYFQFDEILNYKTNNFPLLIGLKTLEEEKTFGIIKESSGPFLYEKYVNNLVIDFNYILDISKIFYLLMDFDYTFSYNKKIKKILLKVINNNEQKANVRIICENKLLNESEDNIQIINLEKCNGKFIMSGNNSLVYLFLPLTLNDSYTIVENKNNVDDFELFNIIQFFFVPIKNEYNSITILLNLDYMPNNYPVYLTYYIDYGIIPYTRNIEKKSILLTNETNIIIPNYSNYSKDDEKYFIYFKFNTTLSKLTAKVIYENIIYLEDQTSLILKSGNHTIIFINDNEHYLNITQNDKRKENSFYSIYKNEKIIEKNKISEAGKNIYIQEPSYNENIKLKIENEDDILLSVSPEYFQDFSFIYYNTKLYIKQIENILQIKLNSASFNSKLEYYIALIDKEENIDHISIHKKFYENNLIYKNIIYSFGKEQIETNFTLKNNFIYDKNYTIIAYGKDNHGESFNYFYFEPKTLFIHKPNIIPIDENIIKSSIIDIDVNTQIFTESSKTDSDEDSDRFDKSNIFRGSDKSNISTIAIIFIVFGGLIVIGGIITVVILFCKNKNKDGMKVESEINTF